MDSKSIVLGIGKRFNGVGSALGNPWNILNPTPVFIFHKGAHILWWIVVGCHNIPGANGCYFGVVVTIEVGSTQ